MVEGALKDPFPASYFSFLCFLILRSFIFGEIFYDNEVEEGFAKYLLPFYTLKNAVESDFEIQKFVCEVRAGDYESFFHRLRSFFADAPYELVRDLELHYQNVLFIIFRLVGFYVKAEYHTSEGRIDLVLQTDKFIYVMEFKLDRGEFQCRHAQY